MKNWRTYAFSALCLLSLCVSTAEAYLSSEAANYFVENARTQVFRTLDEGFPLLPTPHPVELDETCFDGMVLRFHYAGRHAIRGLAEGPDLRTAYLRAVASMVERHSHFLQSSRALPFRVSLSLFKRRQTLSPSLRALSNAWTYGTDGVALREQDGRDIILTPVDYLGRGLTENALLSEFKPVQCSPLTIFSWVCRSSGPGAISLQGGATPSKPLTPSIVRKAVLRAARYLMLRQEKSGRFRYEYDPCKDGIVEGYNMVRHAGVLWALLRLYKSAKDERLLQCSLRGTKYLIQQLERDGSCAYLGRDGRSVLGGTALSILALLNLPPEHKTAKMMALSRALGKGLLSLQHSSGAFYITLADQKAGRLPNPTPRFYPGECLLAICQLWRQDNHDRWSLAARRAAHNQITNFRQNGTTCHWSVQGLVEVGDILHSRPILGAASDMVRVLVARQCSDLNSPLLGSWPTSIGAPTACSAACRLEALGPALEAIRSLDEPVADLENIMLRATQFIISQQFCEENSFLLPQPKEAIGGIRRTPHIFAIRMDINQHAIAALLNTLTLLHQRPCLAAALREESQQG